MSLSTLTAFDRDDLTRRIGNDEELISEIIKDYLLQLPLRIQDISKALIEEDFARAKAAAHALKGASANISAAAMRKTAFEIEEVCAGRYGGAPGPIIERLEKESLRLNEALKNFGYI